MANFFFENSRNHKFAKEYCDLFNVLVTTIFRNLLLTERIDISSDVFTSELL